MNLMLQQNKFRKWKPQLRYLKYMYWYEKIIDVASITILLIGIYILIRQFIESLLRMIESGNFESPNITLFFLIGLLFIPISIGSKIQHNALKRIPPDIRTPLENLLITETQDNLEISSNASKMLLSYFFGIILLAITAALFILLI